jgi:phosphoserine phosphatase
MKILITDSDSTLMKEEILDEVSLFVGKEVFFEIEKITNIQMNGEINLSFYESLKKRVDILVKSKIKVTKKDLKHIAKYSLNFSEGVEFILKEIIKRDKTLKNNFFIFSGGFGEVIKEKINELDISNYEKNIIKNQVYANYFSYNEKDEVIGIDFDKSCMYKDNAKYLMTKSLIEKGIIPKKKEIIGLGDGSNDIGMIPPNRGFSIAYIGNVYRENTVEKAEGRSIKNFFELIDWLE